VLNASDDNPAPTKTGKSGGEDEDDASQFFNVSVEMDDQVDFSVEEGLSRPSPLVGVSFKRQGDFDAEGSKSFVMIRVSGGGNCNLSLPQYLASGDSDVQDTVEISVTRSNEDDMIMTVFPQLEEEQRGLFIAQLPLTAKLGAHVSYDVLNSMFQALAPPEETWIIRVQVQPPFFLGELKDAIVLRDETNPREAIMMCPLRNSIAPKPREGPVVIQPPFAPPPAHK